MENYNKFVGLDVHKADISVGIANVILFDVPCISARVRRTGMENPRFRLEAPVTGMTLVTRQRQLHDEDKSCGIQPAYIRVIYRRLSSCALTRIHGFDTERNKKKLKRH